MTRSNNSKITVTSLCLVGATLWLAAVTKAQHIGEFWAVLETVPLLPESLLVPVSGVVIALEFLLPFGFMVSGLRRGSLIACLALFSCFGLYALWRIATGQLGGCGCFTGLLNLTSVQDLFLDLVLISLSLLALRSSPAHRIAPMRASEVTA